MCIMLSGWIVSKLCNLLTRENRESAENNVVRSRMGKWFPGMAGFVLRIFFDNAFFFFICPSFLYSIITSIQWFDLSWIYRHLCSFHANYDLVFNVVLRNKRRGRHLKIPIKDVVNIKQAFE